MTKNKTVNALNHGLRQITRQDLAYALNADMPAIVAKVDAWLASGGFEPVLVKNNAGIGHDREDLQIGEGLFLSFYTIPFYTNHQEIFASIYAK